MPWAIKIDVFATRMIRAMIGLTKYTPIAHRTLFIYVAGPKMQDIYSERCRNMRQLRTDGVPSQFLK